MGVPDHFTCLLRNLLPDEKQQLELNIWQWTGSKLGKEYVKSVYCHPAYAEYIIQNAGLDDSQVEIKIAGRNIHNLIYADDTILITESEEKLKSLLMKVKEEWNSWLKTEY